MNHPGMTWKGWYDLPPSPNFRKKKVIPGHTRSYHYINYI